METETKCVSCYDEINPKYRYCFDCRNDDCLKQCPGLTANKTPCKLKSVNKGCLFHYNRICNKCEKYCEKDQINSYSKVCYECKPLKVIKKNIKFIDE